MRRPESADAAVLQLPEAGNAIAVSIDGNGRRVACDPYAGTVEAVLECAQNLACVGAEPLGLTNCLNFGNPEKPAPAWQLDRAVSGLADACKALGVPVVGGNVSLYNEGPDGPIYPTPVVGMVGELPDPARAAGCAFAAEGDAIGLIGPFAPPSPAPSWRSSAASSTPGLPQPDVDRGRRRLRESSATRSAPAGSPPPTTSATAASPAPWPSAAIGGGIGCRVDLQPLRERGCSARGGAVRRGRAAASWSAASAPRWRSSARPCSARSAARRSRSPPATAASPSALADAEGAWRSLPAQAERGGA